MIEAWGREYCGNEELSSNSIVIVSFNLPALPSSSDNWQLASLPFFIAE